MFSHKKSYLATIILASTSFILSVVIFLSGILDLFEFKIYDLMSKNFNPSKFSDNICLIYIDQLSIDELRKRGITWPWPRQIYAPVVEFFSESEAVFVDILFTEESSYGVEDDKIFAEYIKKANNVYLPFFLSKSEKKTSIFDQKYIEMITFKYYINTKLKYNSISLPIEEIRKYARGMGNVTILPDEDGVYRRIPLFFNFKDKIVPNFVMSFFIKEKKVLYDNNTLIINESPIYLTDGSLLLKYSSERKPFPIFSFIEVFEASILNSKNHESIIKKDFFKGKIVFIGLTAAGLFDLKPTPISSTTPGVLIHATALENIINKNFIKTAPNIYVFLFVLVISFFIPYAFLRQHSLRINTILFLATVLLVISMGIFLFKMSIYLKLSPIFISLILCSVTALLYSYAVEGRQRSFIKRTFTQYMDSRIVDYLLNNPEYIKPGGQKQIITVFFADIADFTAISEKLTPEDTAFMLHEVLNCLSDLVIKGHGVIDKYIGDCIMAFWGAPVKEFDSETNACMTSVECIKKLEEINQLLKHKIKQDIKIRIGIHTGDAIVGNIGSDRIFNYTVVGDTVNIAARLESANKIFKTSIIVSEDTILQTKNKFVYRELGLIKVKGKTELLKIFELIGRIGEVSPKQEKLVRDYHRGFELYKEQRWIEAKEIFKLILQEYPDDGPSKFYLKKCEDVILGLVLTNDWFIVKM